LKSKTFGSLGEQLALEYLVSIGHKIIFKNFRTYQGEIDLISKSGFGLHIIEVKSSRNEIDPAFSITLKKQNQIHKIAKQFLLQQSQYSSLDYQFDVILVHFMYNKNQISYYPNAFIPKVTNFF
jgi:putative endonuclease